MKEEDSERKKIKWEKNRKRKVQDEEGEQEKKIQYENIEGKKWTGEDAVDGIS